MRHIFRRLSKLDKFKTREMSKCCIDYKRNYKKKPRSKKRFKNKSL